MKNRTVLSCLMSLAIVLVAVRLQAQSSPSRPVAVALVDSLAVVGSRAEILRFSSDLRPDVILLRRDNASPDALAAALATYRESVRRTPGRPGQVGRTVLTEFSVPPNAMALRSTAAEMLATVRRAPVTRVGSYGPGRWSSFSVRVGG